MPGMEEAIKEAVKEASHQGYEAVVLVIVLVSMLTAAGIIGRWLIKSTESRLDEATARETRLAARITSLEGFVETTLVKLVQDNTTLMTKVIETITTFTVTLNGRLCLLSPETQNRVADQLATSIAAKMNAAE